MQVESLAIPDVKIITPRVFRDERGFFTETYNAPRLAEHGVNETFIQDNHAKSGPAGTLRGLHFQNAPRAQGKLLRVVRGSVFDVAVDIRPTSPTFGRHVSAVLTADNWAQIWVPVGFAHGYVTLEPDTEVIYKVTDVYAPDHEGGILWSDPDLAIAWPRPAGEYTLSAKDQRQPTFAAFRAAVGAG